MVRTQYGSSDSSEINAITVSDAWIFEGEVHSDDDVVVVEEEGFERETEKEPDKERHRDRDRDRQRQRGKERGKQRDRQTDRLRKRQTDRECDSDSDSQSESESEWLLENSLKRDRQCEKSISRIVVEEEELESTSLWATLTLSMSRKIVAHPFLFKLCFVLVMLAVPLSMFYITEWVVNTFGSRISLSSFAMSRIPHIESPIQYFQQFGSKMEQENRSKQNVNDLSTSIASAVTTSLFMEVKFKVFNEYTRSVPLSGDYNWSTIVEPYRETWLEVVKPVQGVTYKWYLDGELLSQGTIITTTFKRHTGNTQKITLKGFLGVVQVAECVATIICKYVRREIRSLLAQDRIAFFQAVNVMQRIPNAVGQAIYGKDYHSKDWITRIHLYFGGSQDCDHWHDGAGFVVSHFAYSLLFEKSLQAINPSISLPYWDFTLDSTMLESDSFRNSYIFSDDWFSNAVADNDLHTPQTGRFAYVPVMQNAQNYSRFINSFGLLRSPWNADPTPYLTRSMNVYDVTNNLKPSGCAEYYPAMQQRSWMNMSILLNFDAHGHIHELMGGSFNLQKPLKLAPYSTIAYSAYDGMHQFQHLAERCSKLLWRFGYLQCPNYGSKDCPLEANKRDTLHVYSDKKCRCVCSSDMYSPELLPKILYDSGISTSLIFYDVERDSEISSFVGADGNYRIIEGYSLEESAAIYAEVRDYLCDFGWMGDMFQATSPNDITFWVLHPNMERVWHLSRIETNLRLVEFNETWDNQNNVCVGHRSSDATPFKGLFGETKSYLSVYTNAELYDHLYANNPKLPFVYDSFRFHHCDVLGYDMSGLD